MSSVKLAVFLSIQAVAMIFEISFAAKTIGAEFA